MLSDDDISKEYPVLVGRNPTSSMSPYSDISIAYCDLRQMQSQAVDTLYQCTRPATADSIDIFQARIDDWWRKTSLGDHPLHIQDWINHVTQNMTMFLHRPSVINPNPSAEDYQCCFSSASKAIRLYSKMLRNNSIDCTWMAFHWLFLAAITHLFCLWTNHQIQLSVDWNDFIEDIQTVRMVLSAMAERWRSGRKMLHIYSELSKGTIRIYTNITSATALASHPVRSDLAQPWDLDQTLRSAILDADASLWIDRSDFTNTYMEFYQTAG